MPSTHIHLFVVTYLLSTLLVGKADASPSSAFIPNGGQWSEDIRYRATGAYGYWMVKDKGWAFVRTPSQYHDRHHAGGDRGFPARQPGHSLHFDWVGAQEPCFAASDSSYTRYNFYRGNDPERWATGLHAYRRLRMESLYPGISALMEADGNRLKYSLHVEPGHAPATARLHIRGADSLWLEDDGKKLVIATPRGQYVETMPLVHQPDKPLSAREGPASRRVPCRYRLRGDTLGFAFPEGFDPRYPLIIDPKIVFSSLSGVSRTQNWGFTATYGPQGEGYAGGLLFEFYQLPEPGVFQSDFADGAGEKSRDIALYKLSPDGSRQEYFTYLGGSHNEQPHSLITNEEGDLYVLGVTWSNDFPMAQTGFNRSFNGGGDVFVARLSEDGTQLRSSTFIGGSKLDGINCGSRQNLGDPLSPAMRYNGPDNPLAHNYGDLFRGEITLDDQGRVYVASVTRSNDITAPRVRRGAFAGGGTDAIVARFSSDLNHMHYLRYLGGNGDDAAYSLVPDKEGRVYVVGGTTSSGNWLGEEGLNTQYQGGTTDGWVARLSPLGERIEAGSFMGAPGTSYDQAYFVKLDAEGRPYVMGQTEGGFPVTIAPEKDTAGLFFARMSRDLNRMPAARCIGGSRQQVSLSPSAFQVDRCGKLYVSAWGGTRNHSWNASLPQRMDDLPITGQPSAESQSDGSDFYIAVLSRGMASLEYATYLGGYDPGNPYGDHVDGGTSRINARGILFQSVCATCGVCNNCPDPDKQGSFPTTPNAYSDLNVRGNCSNALVKYDLDGAELFPGFEASLPRCGTVPEVRFTDQSQGADSVLWLFGDGSFSKARNPVHQFDSSGRYRVLQVVYNERSCNPADSLSREIIVAEKPATRLKTKIGCGNRVEFRYLGEAAPSEIVWWLGNGESVTTDTPFLSYTYADTGSYSVSAYASYAQNDRYCDDTLERTVRVHPPRALFEAEGQHCSRTVAFEAQSPGPSRWAFGDGNTSEEPNPRHTYADTGRYTVRLVIYPDQAQCRDTFSRSVYVAGAPSNQLTYTFDSCLSQGTFTSQNQAEAEVLWIFGGTDTAEGRSVAYHFRDTGRFEVRMVTRPELACADTQRTQVDIGSGGFALWAVDSLLPCQQAVRLRNQSSAFDSVRWRVGDTIVSRSPHPRLEFASSGFYRLSLQAFLSNGCVDTFAREIQIPDRPEAGFRLQRPECPNAVEAQSEQVAKGESVLWRWGDGTATLGDAARHYYASAGRYTIQQVVRNPNGCSDTATMDFLVEATSKAGLAYEWQTCGKALRVANRSEGAQAYQWSLMSRADTTDLGTDSVLLLRELPSSAFKLRLLINPGLACADTAIQTVERPRISADALQLPNIITPNGDRRNDRWRIDWRQAPQNDFFESGCLDITLKVFNRWGELLHRREQDSFPLEWDGHARGSRVESGTYYYFLTVGPETFRGSLTVTY